MLKKIYVCSLIFWSGFMPAAVERPRTPENQIVDRHNFIPSRPRKLTRQQNATTQVPRMLFPLDDQQNNQVQQNLNNRN